MLFLTSIIFIEYKILDIEYEKDVFFVAQYLVASPNIFNDYSESKYLESTDIFKNWDKIKLYQLVEPDYLNESFGVTKAKTKEYSVIKINGSSLKKRGIKIQEDLNQSSTNKSNEEKCFKAFVGTNIIPIDELEIVGTFDTDLEMSKERAVYHRKVTERDMRIELNETWTPIRFILEVGFNVERCMPGSGFLKS